MNIPDNIKYILERIHKSEDEWKALYMAAWGCVYYINEKYKKLGLWEAKLNFGLPGSKNKMHPYTPKELDSILRTRDIEFTLGHLQTLFSLLEELSDSASEILFDLESNMSKWKYIEQFFQKIGLSQPIIKELCLAKQTRNCFIHNGSKIDKLWLNTYQEARGVLPSNLDGKNLGEGLLNIFHQIEDWHDLIVNTAEKIKEKISQRS